MNIFINLSVIFWSLFPALMSYTQPASTPLKVELRQLVSNSDLLIAKASPYDNQPSGFTYSVNTTNITLTNGIATFTATAKYASFSSQLRHIIDMKYYMFARYKTDSNLVRLVIPGTTGHSGSNTYEFVSNVFTAIDTRLFAISDGRTSDWTPISVDYMGAINITDLVSRGCLPSGLTDLEYKALLDMVIGEIGGTFQGSYFYTEPITDNYKWFSTGFVEKTGERDFIDYLGFFVWLVVPYLFAFLVYKLLKGVIYG